MVYQVGGQAGTTAVWEQGRQLGSDAPSLGPLRSGGGVGERDAGHRSSCLGIR